MNSLKAKGCHLIRITTPALFNGRASVLPVLFLLLLPLLFASGCARKQADILPSPVAAAPAPPRIEEHVVTAAKTTIGVRYKYGGTSPETGFDCSGLVCWAYEQVGVQLPRRAKDQLSAGTRISSKSELKPGDIVVFKGTRSRSGWHSGIYSGNGMFVHSPASGKTVMESSLRDGYFARKFAGASRIAHGGQTALMHASMVAGYQDNAARPSGRQQLVASAAENSASQSLALVQGGKQPAKSRAKSAKSGKTAKPGKNAKKSLQAAKKQNTPAKAAKPAPAAASPSPAADAGPQAAVISPAGPGAHL